MFTKLRKSASGRNPSSGEQEDARFSNECISWRQVLELKRKLLSGEIGDGIQLATATVDHHAKKMFEMSFEKGEVVVATDTSSYPNWKGYKRVGHKKGSFDSRSFRVKPKEEYSLQDMMDFMLGPIDKAPFVQQLEAEHKSSDDAKAIAVFAGPLTRFGDVVTALEEYFEQKQDTVNPDSTYIWMEMFNLSAAKLDQMGDVWINHVDKQRFSEVLLVFEKFSKLPTCFTSPALACVYAALNDRKPVHILMTRENRSWMLGSLWKQHEQVLEWLGDIDVQKPSGLAICYSKTTEQKHLNQVEEAINAYMKTLGGVPKLNRMITKLVSDWYMMCLVTAHERLSIKVSLDGETVTEEMKTYTKQVIEFADKVCAFLLEHGQSELAVGILEKTIAHGAVVYGDTNCLEMGILRLKLGRCRRSMGEVTSAIEEFEKAETILENITNEDEKHASSLVLLDVLTECASASDMVGQKQKAMEKLNKMLQMKIKIYNGEEHQEVLATKQELVKVQIELGLGSDAVLGAVKVLELSKKLNGDHSAKTATSMFLLSDALRIQGRSDDAIPMLEKAVDVRKEIFGSRDQQVLKGMADLQILQQAKGKKE